MQSEIAHSVKSSAKNGWLLLILGGMFIFLGIWIFRTPLASYISFAYAL